MSRWNKYAVQAQELAHKTISDFQAASEAFEKAKSRQQARLTPANQAFPLQGGGLDPVRAAMDDASYEALMASAEAAKEQKNLATAVAEMRIAAATMENGIRGDLEKDLKDFYAAKADKLEPETVQLLNTGILTAEEVAELLRQATVYGNNTMRRVIGKYALEAAEKLSSDPRSKEDAAAFRMIAADANSTETEVVLEKYDGIVQIYRMCIGNLQFSKQFDELTAADIANF